MKNLNRLYPFALLLYFIALVFVSYFSVQKQFLSILIPSAIAFIGYIILLKVIDKNEKLNEFLTLIFIVKIAAIFSFPHLSDDIYRFWWDGFLSCNGFSPYEFSPTEVMSHLHDENIYPALLKNYSFLNSADYHTVYPLICQWVFRISASLSGDNLYTFNLVLKIIFLITDCLILFFLLKLLKIFQLPKKNAILYYGNPLCIIELNSNLHFEIFLIAFFVISIYLYEKKKFLWGGITLGLSIVSKLVSFLWIPLFIKRPTWKKWQLYFVFGLLLPINLFLLVFLPSVGNYKNSLGLYFQKFEFNSFIYRPVLQYCDNHKWYQAEPKVSLVLMSIFCIIYLIIIVKEWIHDIPGFSFRSAWIILFLYILLSTTVHPWYLTPLIFLSVFTFQYAGIAWSFLILLSYARYDPILKQYEPCLILLEYLTVVGFFTYEFHKSRIVIADQ